MLRVGYHLNVPGSGTGVLASRNEDGTWNVELDDGSEVDIRVQTGRASGIFFSESTYAGISSEAETHLRAAHAEFGEAVDAAHQAVAQANASDIASLPSKTHDVSEDQCVPYGHTSCSVCLEEFAVGDECVTLPCAHVFHKGCAKQWLMQDKSCPLCKQGIGKVAALAAQELREDREFKQERSRCRSCIFVFFLLMGLAGPFCAVAIQGLVAAQEWLRAPAIVVVEPRDTAQIEKIFFGGNPWMVSCVTAKSALLKPPATLEKTAALLLPEGVRVARVHCWELIQTRKGKQTLAQRFGLGKKPPVVMVTTGKGKPKLLVSSGLSAEELARRALVAASLVGR